MILALEILILFGKLEIKLISSSNGNFFLLIRLFLRIFDLISKK